MDAADDGRLVAAELSSSALASPCGEMAKEGRETPGRLPPPT